MAGNDWINSYLEAILDVGPGLDDAKSSLLLRERGRFSPTRYFVDNVIGFDETDLHRSWVKAQATRSPQERNTRLENMCWRIWNLARQKKQLESEEANRAAKRRMEREKGRRLAVADMSEDLSEGEKGETVGDVSAHGESQKGRLPRMSSLDAMEAWANQQKGKKLYIVLISLHGLIRGENMELGRDSDTGGQVKYVVELARALASMPGVYRVDLLTRQVACPEVDSSYGEPIEMLCSHNPDDMTDEVGESSGAYIIRIPFGPREKYIDKELLWPHIPEFVDGALSHVIQMSKVLGEQLNSGHPVWPVAIHGHYADAGDSAARLSGALNVPMLFTGHSLGRDKLEQLLRQGRLTKDEINTTYKIMRRIEAEESSLDSSEVVITSTRQEIDEQWRLYDGFDPVLEKKLRARIRRNVSCYGRFMPRMVVIPPGMEFNHIVPHDGDMDGETEGGEEHQPSPDPPIWTEIMRFFTNPRKPMILALARPDPKKNLTTLVKAFGECRPLRELANLTLIMGNRENIDEMSSTSASMLLSIIKMIDKYDLYGQVAYPKHHKQSEVADIYRLAAKTKGVFINPAFIEPFGLTLIEAAAHGLPMVATKNGGPVDIHRVLDNGLLIDPHDQQSIADALLKLVADKQLWAKCRANGLRNIHLFSWKEHCKTYLSRIASCKPRHPGWLKNDNDDDDDENSESDSPSDSLRDMQDISLNLKFSIGSEDQKNKLENVVLSHSKNVAKNVQKTVSGDKTEQPKFPAIRRRTHVFVIAIDADDIGSLFENVQKIFEAVENEKNDGSIGFILATSLQMAQIHSFLVSNGVNPSVFDAFICNSGADLYYSSSHSEDNPFVFDLYYHSHIEYRWGGEGLRKTLVKWASSIVDKTAANKNEEHVVTEDEEVSTNYCYAFNIHKPGLVPPVKELRKLMRIQALRCHVIYCQNGKKINVIPVSASRSQALRYLYLRWGMDLSKVVVFVGESGDTDYEGFLGGVHKSVVLKGIGGGTTNQLHANRVYPLSDVTPTESTNIIHTPEEFSPADIRASLGKLGVLKA
ncbi:putative sucrose-phosphate synthase [Helianthus annuus]|nr:putative sucrose-phosphate synthase [Helianthus annuus]KAJ0591718.1 putative sucrose-phosphate synthase [Helianthus annuus]KAJ0772603.1 putative sucrose-phosphate synthase [Helianthus annuus]